MQVYNKNNYNKWLNNDQTTNYRSKKIQKQNKNNMLLSLALIGYSIYQYQSFFWLYMQETYNLMILKMLYIKW